MNKYEEFLMIAGVGALDVQRAIEERKRLQELRNIESRKRAARRYALQHREEINARQRAARAADPDRYREYDRKRYERKKAKKAAKASEGILCQSLKK